jgi:WD40 repeat protein
VKYTYILFFLFICLDAYTQKPKLVLPIGHTEWIFGAEFSPNSKKIITHSHDNTAKVWDVQTGQLLINLGGHSEHIFSADFSTDGKSIFTSTGNIIKKWDADTGELLTTIKVSTGQVNYMEFSPDRKKLVRVAEDSTAQLWDVETSQILINLRMHGELVLSADFSPDGKKIATTSNDSSIKIWDIWSGKLIMYLKNQTKHNVAYFSGDSKKLATTSDDSLVKIWNIQDGQLLTILKGHASQVNSAEFSPDNRIIVTTSVDSTAKIWDTQTGQLLNNLKGHNGIVWSGFFSPDGKNIITYPEDRTVKIWDTNTGKQLVNLTDHLGFDAFPAISPDSKLIATRSSVLKNSTQKIVKIWNIRTGQLLKNLKGQSNWFNDAAISPDGKKIVTASSDSTAKLWHIQDGKLINLKAHTARVNTVDFSSDGKSIVTASSDSSAKIWHSETGQMLFNLKSQALIFSAHFSPDNKKIVTNSDDSTIKVWDIHSGRHLLDLKCQTEFNNNASFSNDSKKILITSGNFSAKIWDIQTGQLLTDLKGHISYVNSAKFSPDSKKIVTTSDDSTAKIWDSQTGELLINIKEHAGSVISGIFSPDSRIIITYSEGGTVKMWSAETGQLIKILNDPTSYIYSANFTPDGKMVVTSSDDYTVKLWDTKSGTPLINLKGHTGAILSTLFSPDGKIIVTVSRDYTAKFWDTQTGELLFSFTTMNSADYLVWDKDYRYDGSEVARKYLYIVCGDEVIDLEQLKNQLWEPGLVKKIMQSDTANMIAKRLSDLQICGSTPIIEKKEQELQNGNIEYIITPRSKGLGVVQLYVNQQLVRSYVPEDLRKTGNNYILTVDSSLIVSHFLNGVENKLLVKANTSDKSIFGRGSDGIIQMKEFLSKGEAKPNCFIISVGIQDYKGDKLDLTYSSKDASDFSKAITMSAKKLLENEDTSKHVFSYLFNHDIGNTEPTKNAIFNRFSQISKIAKADDVVILFMAGHGVSSENTGKFYFLTSEASEYDVRGVEESIGISVQEIDSLLRSIRAKKQVVILDICRSGNALKEMQQFIAKRGLPADQIKALENLKDQTGCIMISATEINQAANEASYYGQGLLTYGLLNSIKKGTGLRDNKFIEINNWFNKTVGEVKEIAYKLGIEQSPQVFGQNSYDIGLVDKNVLSIIKLKASKPLITASNLTLLGPLNLDEFGLSDLINDALKNEELLNPDCPFAYAKESNTEDSYRVTGNYELRGQILIVKAYLVKGKTSKGVLTKMEFELPINDKNNLASLLIDKIRNKF